MRSELDKSARLRSAAKTAPIGGGCQFSLYLRDRRGRLQRRSFATSVDLLAALERLRRNDDVHIRTSDVVAEVV